MSQINPQLLKFMLGMIVGFSVASVGMWNACKQSLGPFFKENLSDPRGPLRNKTIPCAFAAVNTEGYALGNMHKLV